MICEEGKLIVNGCNSSEEFRGSYESKMKHITEQLKIFKERLEVTIKSLRESHRRFKLEYIDDSFFEDGLYNPDKIEHMILNTKDERKRRKLIELRNLVRRLIRDTHMYNKNLVEYNTLVGFPSKKR